VSLPYRILLVEPDSRWSAATERLLSEAGYLTVPVRTFDDATRQLTLDSPDLLVTAVRLGAFNGLHLVLRGRGDYPCLPMIVTGEEQDPLLADEVARYGARFIPKSLEPERFLRLVAELLSARYSQGLFHERRWPRRPAGLPVTVSRAPARVVDLSYGGLRLELEGSLAELKGPIELDFPTLGLSFQALPRWTKPVEAEGRWWCGAEVAPEEEDSQARQTWREVVDSLSMESLN
jgi:DNA-binding response OmpR family regulator